MEKRELATPVAAVNSLIKSLNESRVKSRLKSRAKSRAKSLVHAAALPLLRAAARAYVPGPHLEDAMAWARRLHAQGMGCTLGYFNADGEPPAEVARTVCASVEALNRLNRLEGLGGPEGQGWLGFPGYVSVKVPALAYDFNLLDAIAEHAARVGQRLHLDSHGPETAEPTWRALQHLQGLRARWPGLSLGLSVPGRWARSAGDAIRAANLGVRVRVVKGQWDCAQRPDVGDPKRQREGFLAVVDALASRAAEVAVATHDVPLALEALARLRRAGTAAEWELLLGLPRRAAVAAARRAGVPVRVYVPYGQAWLPYALGQVLRQPRRWPTVVGDAVSGWWERG